MQNVLIGRQPIFDRNFQVTAYELLFKAAEDVGRNEDAHMTAQVLVGAVMDIGLERLAGSLKVYINVSASFLLHGAEAAALLEPGRVGIEVLGSVPYNERTVAAVKRLKAHGFSITLDDRFYTARQEASLVEQADIIKIDLNKADDLLAKVRELRKYPARLLAENVESYEQYEMARNLNFDYFQGHFFCKPDVVEGRKMPDSKLAILRALQQVMTAEAISDIQDVIKQDVSLSYRLLKYINSAAFGMSREIESIEQALALLGLNNIRRWLSLLSLSALGENKPLELMRVSLFRARFLEGLAQLRKEKETGDDFLLGMFSVLDALLDVEMKDALEDVYLPEGVRRGLLDPDSDMGARLQLVRALEDADWEAVNAWCHSGKAVSLTDLTRIHGEALAWSDKQVGAIGF